jgi:hypothetical protein
MPQTNGYEPFFFFKTGVLSSRDSARSRFFDDATDPVNRTCGKLMLNSKKVHADRAFYA